jgi:hypothetical protein
VVDRDRRDARVGIGRHEIVQERRDTLVDPVQDAAVDRRPGERGHHRFRYRLDVNRPLEPRAAEDIPDALLPGARDQERVQIGQRRRPEQCPLEQRGVQPGPGRCGGRRCGSPRARAHRSRQPAPARQQPG